MNTFFENSNSFGNNPGDLQNRASLKETIPHGDHLFPLEVHEIETDIQLIDKLNCHWHEDFEFFVVTKGRANFHIDTNTYPVSVGDVIFINSNHLHSATSVDSLPFAFFAVVFHPSFLAGFHKDAIEQKFFDSVLEDKVSFPPFLEKGQTENKKILDLLYEIKNSYEKKDACYELFIKMKLFEIWYLLFQNAIYLPTIPSGDYRIGRMKSILEYIHLHYDSNFTLEELSTYFHMSKGYFCKFFKSMAKISVVDYANAYRIHQSVSLLEKTDQEISNIALSCGFNNISYFNKLFKNFMHCTPREYRRNYYADNQP